jgi:hypothetical protein
VLLTFGRIKRILPTTAPFDLWGTLSEDQVVVWVPVVAVQDTGALLHARKFAMFVPYIWLDDPLSIASGREAGGWPKSWGWPIFSAPGAPLDLKLDTYGWNFDPHNHPRRRRLLRITEGVAANGGEAPSFDSLGDLFGEFWSSVRDDDGFLVPDLDLGFDLLADAFRAELPELFFKQIRSADDPHTAALQQVVASGAKILRLSGRPLLGEHHLQVWHVNSSPVRQELGLVDQTARLGFKVEMDFVQEPGRILWDSADREIVIPDPIAQGVDRG